MSRLRYLLVVVRPYLMHRGSTAWALILGGVVLDYLNNTSQFYMTDYFSKLGTNITKGGSLEEYHHLLWCLGGCTVAWVAASVGYATVVAGLILDWRIWTTDMTLRQWVVNEAYLGMQEFFPQLSPIDQRLENDPDIFLGNFVWFCFNVLDAFVKVYTYAKTVWDNSPYLFFACVGCAAVSYVFVFWIGRRLPKLNQFVWSTEATLRNFLQIVPREADAIAMQRAEGLVLSQSLGGMAALRSGLLSILQVNAFLNVFNSAWNKVVEYSPFAFLGFMLKRGTIADIGIITKGTQAFGFLYSGLTIFTSQYTLMSVIGGQIERLGPLYEALAKLGADYMPAGNWIEYVEGPRLAFDNVTVYTDYLTSSPVVQGLTLKVDTNTMFAGPTTKGKSQLAQAIGHRAMSGTGRMERPARNKIAVITKDLFLPDNVSLREFLTSGAEIGEERILEILKVAKLPNIVKETGGLDEKHEWKDKLSPPQKVLLCFAAALLQKPELLVNNQATDALEEPFEDAIYKALQTLGIRVVTFTSRTRLAKWHPKVIELGEDGTPHEKSGPEFEKPGWNDWVKKKYGLNGNGQKALPAQGEQPPAQLPPMIR